MEMSYRQPGPQNVIQTYSGLVMNGLVPNGLDPNGLGNGEPERAEMGAKRPISASNGNNNGHIDFKRRKRRGCPLAYQLGTAYPLASFLGGLQ